MTGRRTRRWLDRLRAAIGRGPSSPDRTGLDGFSARSRPQTVKNPPPHARSSAPTARERADTAPAAPAGREAPGAPARPVAREAPVADEPAAPPAPDEVPDPTPEPSLAEAGDDEARPDEPRVRVHRGRLERRVAPLELSPTEAVRLAEEGRAGLSRRELPPDVEGDDPGGSGDSDAE